MNRSTIRLAGPPAGIERGGFIVIGSHLIAPTPFRLTLESPIGTLILRTDYDENLGQPRRSRSTITTQPQGNSHAPNIIHRSTKQEGTHAGPAIYLCYTEPASLDAELTGRSSGCLATSTCSARHDLVISEVRGNQMTEESLRIELIEAISSIGFDGAYIVSRLSIGPFGCWNWIGWIDNGYGRSGRKDKSRIHAVVYRAAIGDLPEGLVPDHLCRNRACSNPLHIEPVTAAENTRRGHQSRGPRTECLKGHSMSGKNLSVNKHGIRRCMECKREKNRRARRRWKSLQLQQLQKGPKGEGLPTGSALQFTGGK